MNILIYQPRVSYYVGGAEIVAREQARFLQKLGHHVSILTTRSDYIEPCKSFHEFIDENSDIDIHYLDLPQALAWIYEQKAGHDWDRWNLESLNVARHALSHFDFTPFDLIAYHNVLDAIGCPLQMPSIIHLHGYPETIDDMCRLVLMEEQRPLVAVSNLVGQKWKELASIKQTVPTIYNGIDTKRFAPEDTKPLYDFLYIGRHIEIKGIQYIIKALSLIDEKEAKLAIAGTGPYTAELKKMVDDLGLSQQVDFLGFVPDEKLCSLYNQSKIIVLPSYAREGVLTTMLEAAACARPVITTQNTSMEEFLKDGVNGLTVPGQDSHALSQAMSKLYHDKNLRDMLGQNNFKSVTQDWSWEQQAFKLSNLYETLIK